MECKIFGKIEVVRVVEVSHPISKGGKAEDIRNHRPVALLSIPAKLIESTLHLIKYPQIKHRISPQQHGFYKSCSVNTNQLQCTHFILAVLMGEHRWMRFTLTSRRYSIRLTSEICSKKWIAWASRRGYCVFSLLT